MVPFPLQAFLTSLYFSLASFGGRNRKCAEAFIKTGKSFEVLEKELLNGQKLQGAVTSDEIYSYLAAKGRLEGCTFLPSVPYLEGTVLLTLVPFSQTPCSRRSTSSVSKEWMPRRCLKTYRQSVFSPLPTFVSLTISRFHPNLYNSIHHFLVTSPILYKPKKTFI